MKMIFCRCTILPMVLAMLSWGLLLSSPPKCSGANMADLSPLKVMIAAQQDMKTLSADFTQTRALHTLRSPLQIKGKLWFQSPDKFRWELGTPPKTVIVGNHESITIIQPLKMKAQRKFQSSGSSFSESSSLGMLRIPGGGDFQEFQKLVQVLAIETSGSRCHVEMLPKDPAAARGLASINLDFDCVTGHWLSFKLVTREGTSILSEFSNVQVNQKISRKIFEYDLTGYRVTSEKN